MHARYSGNHNYIIILYLRTRGMVNIVFLNVKFKYISFEKHLSQNKLIIE